LAAAALRRVQADCSIEIATNAYSVPWRLIGETVRVVVAGGRCRNTSSWLEEAGDGGRSRRPDRHVDPAQADGDPRPAATPTSRQPQGLVKRAQ